MDWLDFYNVYIVSAVQIVAGAVFFLKCLRRQRKSDHCRAARRQTNRVSAALYGIVTLEVMQLGFGITDSLLCMVGPFLFVFHRKIFLAAVLGLSLLALSGAALCYYFIYRYFVSEGAGNNRYSLMTLIPVLMIFLMGIYIGSSVYGNENTITAEEIRSGAYVVSAVHCEMLIIQLLALASLFCVLYVYKKLTMRFQAETQLALLEQETRLLRQYVDEAGRRYDLTRSFRHDIRNHMLMVRELLQNEGPEAALRYMSAMEDLTGDITFPCNTNNPAVDILTGNKLGIADSAGIDVSCSLHLPRPCPVSDIDFCIILSNALDNAIHACREMREEDRFIRISGRMQGDFILIGIENSYPGNGLPGYGTGLTNIKSVAEKYGGTMEIEAEGKVCRLHVLLNLSQHSEDISLQSG